MYRIVFTIFFITLSISSKGQAIAADRIVGEWLSENKDRKIEVYKVGQEFFGKLIWSASLFEADGKTARKDIRNRNVSLRDRPLQNVDILTNFIYGDEIWDGGKMYDPQSGKTYNCIMRLKNELLEVRSYIGFPLLGSSTYWKRSPRESL
jgi:uncharacterized protein (DUF2147 family)